MHDTPPDPPTAPRWRHRLTLATLASTLLLLIVGGLVTSINAGLSVPDWPTSFGSLDPFRPFPEWWTVTPVLAEHGHRLLGALTGLLTLGLTVWTVRVEHRAWVRRLTIGALVLVIFQGVLGGLRVVWISLDLAVVHACTAQLFVALLVVLAVVTSPSWIRTDRDEPPSSAGEQLMGLSALVTAVLYVQVVLGALLRHPGQGIDTVLLVVHILGAVVAGALVLVLGRAIRRSPPWRLLRLHRLALYGLLAAQFALGITAYLALRSDAAAARPPGPAQIALSTAHLATGALLFATAVSVTLWVSRRPLLTHVQREESNEGSTPSTRTQPV